MITDTALFRYPHYHTVRPTSRSTPFSGIDVSGMSRVDRHVHLGRPTLIRMRAQPVADHLFPSAMAASARARFVYPEACCQAMRPWSGVRRFGRRSLDCSGGTAIVATRVLAGAADPTTIGLLRFGGGALLLLPLALIKGERWPSRGDWPAGIGLGLLFFGLFPVLFNAALIYTTAARGALALSTTPLKRHLGRFLIKSATPERALSHLARSARCRLVGGHLSSG